MSAGRLLGVWASLSIALAGAPSPGFAQGQAARPVSIVDGDCEGSCSAAPSAVYQCLADEMTPDVVKHSQLYAAVTQLQARPTQSSAERFFGAVSRTSCKASDYRISVASLGAIITQHPLIGREFDLQGTLVRDNNSSALRLQTPDYSRFWIVEESSVDPAWLGQQVAFRAVVTGAGTVKASSARKTLDESQVYIQCLATGFSDRKLYLSETFLGSSTAMSETRQKYAAFLRSRYGGVFTPTTEAHCDYNVYAERAAELHAFTSRNNADRLVLTGWKGN